MNLSELNTNVVDGNNYEMRRKRTLKFPEVTPKNVTEPIKEKNEQPSTNDDLKTIICVTLGIVALISACALTLSIISIINFYTTNYWKKLGSTTISYSGEEIIIGIWESEYDEPSLKRSDTDLPVSTIGLGKQTNNNIQKGKLELNARTNTGEAVLFIDINDTFGICNNVPAITILDTNNVCPNKYIGINNQDPQFNLDVFGNANINGNLYVTGTLFPGNFTATSIQGINVTQIHPLNGQILVYNGTELVYEYNNGNAISLQNVPIATTVPTVNQILVYNGSYWIPQALNSTPNANADQLQGIFVSNQVPTQYQVLSYIGTQWIPANVFNSFTSTLAVYVDKSGNDTGGNGSPSKPFLTVNHAYSVITSASSTNTYTINIGPGNYVETSLGLKPWIWLQGQPGGATTLSLASGNITFAGLTAGATVSLGISSLMINSPLVLDSTNLTDIGAMTMTISNIKMNANFIFYGISAENIGIYDSVFLTGTTINSIFNAFIIGTEFGVSFDIFDTNAILGQQYVIVGCYINEFFVTANTHTTDVDISGTLIANGLTLTGSHVEYATDVSSIPFGATINAGVSFFPTNDIQYINYEPGDPSNWNPVPSQPAQALDLLAAQSGNAVEIQGVPVSATAPKTGQFLGYTGSQWAPENVTAGLVVYTPANASLWFPVPSTVQSALDQLANDSSDTGNAQKLQGICVYSTTPTTGQYLEFNGTCWVPMTIIATQVSYTPANSSLWLPVPTTVQLALDQLANDSYDTGNAQKIQGVCVYSTTPTINQYLEFNGTCWVPMTIVASQVSYTPVNSSLWSPTPTTVQLALDQLANDSYGIGNAQKIQGISVSTTTPLQNQVLTYNGSLWAPANVFNPITSTLAIYVDKSGSDTTGNGSPSNPFLTIVHAYSSATSASSTNRYTINVGPGVYSETSLTLKPWVWLQGQAGGATTVSSSGNIGFSGLTSGAAIQLGLLGLVISTPLNLNSTNLTSSGSLLMTIREVQLTSGSTFTFIGIHVETLEIYDSYFTNTVTFSGLLSTYIAGCDIQSQFIITDTYAAGGQVYYITGCYIGIFSVTAPTTPTEIIISGTYILGGLTLSGAQVEYNPDVSSIIFGTSISNGAVVTPLNDVQYIHYTPAVSGNWSPVPTQPAAALDQLASRLTGLSASSVAYTPATPSNWPTLPTTVNTALDILVTDTIVNSWFGDGADGVVTISTPTTLTRNMYYQNLTVTSFLNAAAWQVFVRGTLTVTSTGVLEVPAVNAVGQTGANANAAETLGVGSTGGNGGNAGILYCL